MLNVQVVRSYDENAPECGRAELAVREPEQRIMTLPLEAICYPPLSPGMLYVPPYLM